MDLRKLRVGLTMLAAVWQPASAEWHDTPRRLDAGFHAVDTLGSVDRATIHVRLAADSRECAGWSLIWNYTDDANYTRATLYLPSDMRHSDLYATEALVEVVRYAAGRPEEVGSHKIADAIDGGKGMNSLKLVYDGGRATLYAGSTDQKEVCAVPFAADGGVVAYLSDGPVRVQRADVRSHASSAPRSCAHASVDQLAEHIRASADPMEGFWEYLDRSTDPAKAVTGGSYTLATVRSGDAYDIVYIKGAEVASAAWRPLQLKGRLKPTIFKGNYDMEWITASMQTISKDADAQLSDDGAILTLRFPALGAQVRLRRLIL